MLYYNRLFMFEKCGNVVARLPGDKITAFWTFKNYDLGGGGGYEFREVIAYNEGDDVCSFILE
jgi:hypothetical protein